MCKYIHEMYIGMSRGQILEITDSCISKSAGVVDPQKSHPGVK